MEVVTHVNTKRTHPSSNLMGVKHLDRETPSFGLIKFFQVFLDLWSVESPDFLAFFSNYNWISLHHRGLTF